MRTSGAAAAWQPVHGLPGASRTVWRVAPRVRLIGRTVRHPGRAILRLLLRARVGRLDLRADNRRFLAWLWREFGANAAALEAEYLASEFRREFLARRRALEAREGPRRLGTSDAWCLKALYLLVRAARPRVVVETGVLYGASSAHFLAALAANGDGELHSVDLPRNPCEPAPGALVPEALRSRWTLMEGDSRRELPHLLRRLGPVDCSHHDSLHTFEHMTWEFQTVLPYLTPRGILASHDVLVSHSMREILRPNAFQAFCRHHGLRWSSFQNSGFAFAPAPRRCAADRPAAVDSAGEPSGLLVRLRPDHARDYPWAPAGVWLAAHRRAGDQGLVWLNRQRRPLPERHLDMREASA